MTGTAGLTPRTTGLLLGAALAVRLLLLAASPRVGYFWDHDDFARLGLDTVDHGFLTVYDRPATPAVAVLPGAERRLGHRPFARRFDHPPLLGLSVAASGHLFVLLRPDRLVNTFESRLAFGIWNLLADLLLAFGGARLCRRLGGGEAEKRIAFVALLFLPPLVWGSATWGQLDAPAMALSLFMVLALVEGRPVRAGALFGLLAAFKPQALFFVPVWGLALSTGRPRARYAAGLLSGAAAFALAVLPHTLHSGLAWYRASWDIALPRLGDATALHAYNVWYVDFLFGGDPRTSSLVLGAPRSAWGLASLGVALAVAFAHVLRRWKAEPRGLLLFAGVSLLLAVLLPTGIHERYVQYPLPFLVVAAAIHPPLRNGVALFTGAAFAQVAWPLWHGAGTPVPLLAVVTGTALAGAAVVLWQAARLRPEDP